MAKNHAVCIGTHCAFWDIDAYQLVGIAGADIDNGTFLTLGDMSPADDGAYEFTVTAGENPDLIAMTPPVGYDAIGQIYDDPRYFTNVAGKPISVKRLVKGDFIEVTAAAFTADPSTGKFAKVGSTGKLTAQANNNSSDAHFEIKGSRTIDIGGELVPSYALMKLA